MCLWALREYREWSQRLASPALLPWARRACELVSANRLSLSAWFKGMTDDELGGELETAAGGGLQGRVPVRVIGGGRRGGAGDWLGEPSGPRPFLLEQTRGPCKVFVPPFVNLQAGDPGEGPEATHFPPP